MSTFVSFSPLPFDATEITTVRNDGRYVVTLGSRADHQTRLFLTPDAALALLDSLTTRMVAFGDVVGGHTAVDDAVSELESLAHDLQWERSRGDASTRIAAILQRLGHRDEATDAGAPRHELDAAVVQHEIGAGA